jgi:hypothetical protein
MKPRLTLAALIATSLLSGTALAQTTSPNPNKAQNSDMRTQSDGTFYVYPSDTYLYLDRGYYNPGTTTYVYPSSAPSTVWVVPGEPTAGTRNVYVPRTQRPGMNNTPNPNKVQNNGVPTQYDNSYDTYYIYRIDPYAPY